MTTDAISETVFIREYTRELHNKNAAVFAGTGLSMGSGYVDCRTGENISSSHIGYPFTTGSAIKGMKISVRGFLKDCYCDVQSKRTFKEFGYGAKSFF